MQSLDYGWPGDEKIKEFTCYGCHNLFSEDSSSELYNREGDQLCLACAKEKLEPQKTDRKYTDNQMTAVAEFQAVRGKLIIEMLTGNCGNIFLCTDKYDFEIHRGIGSEWFVDFYSDSTEGKFFIAMSDEEERVYNTATQFDDFCANYGVKR